MISLQAHRRREHHVDDGSIDSSVCRRSTRRRSGAPYVASRVRLDQVRRVLGDVCRVSRTLGPESTPTRRATAGNRSHASRSRGPAADSARSAHVPPSSPAERRLCRSTSDVANWWMPRADHRRPAPRQLVIERLARVESSCSAASSSGTAGSPPPAHRRPATRARSSKSTTRLSDSWRARKTRPGVSLRNRTSPWPPPRSVCVTNPYRSLSKPAAVPRDVR